VPLLYSAEEAANHCREFIYYQKFSNYANEYMAPKVAAFETKDEFETEAQYASRVTEESVAALKEQLTKEAEVEYIKMRGKTITLRLTLGTYDAENEIFAVSDITYGDFTVKVPLAVARDFKSLWDGLTKTPALSVQNDTLAVDSITFRMPDGTEFTAVR
jgi:hypothetical protein